MQKYFTKCIDCHQPIFNNTNRNKCFDCLRKQQNIFKKEFNTFNCHKCKKNQISKPYHGLCKTCGDKFSH